MYRGFVLFALSVPFFHLLPGVAAAGPFDQAYYGTRWMSPPDQVKPNVRGRIREEKPRLSPWDVPHVRELGHLYFLEDRDFSRIVSAFPGHNGGETVLEYYFFRNQLSMIRVFFREKGVSFQALLESLEADYGKPRKEESRSPDEVFILHRFERPVLILEVSYHPRKVEGGFSCDDLTLLIVHRKYIEQVSAYHESLKKKYGKQ